MQGEPLSDELSEKLAWCYSRTKQYKEAIEIYKILLQKQPDKAVLHYSLGYQYYVQKDYKTAVPNFEKALVYYPNYFKVKYRLAYALMQTAGIDDPWKKDVFWKALKQLEDCHYIYNKFNEVDAEKEKSTYANVCALHGKSIVNSKNYLDKAIEYFQLSLNLKEDDDVKYQLAKALFYSRGDGDAALQILPPKNKSFYISQLKSDIYAARNDFAKSNEILLNEVRFSKKDFLFQRLANNYISIANFEKAKEYALQAVQLDKRNHKNYFVCGQVFKAMKQFKTAVTYFEQACEKKREKFNTDYIEAMKEIDSIMDVTARNPTDLIVESVLMGEKITLVQSKGTIKRYKEDRGFGFISEDKTRKELFFHIKQFPFGAIPQQGMAVCFEIEKTEKGEQAIKIYIA